MKKLTNTFHPLSDELFSSVAGFLDPNFLLPGSPRRLFFPGCLFHAARMSRLESKMTVLIVDFHMRIFCLSCRLSSSHTFMPLCPWLFLSFLERLARRRATYSPHAQRGELPFMVDFARSCNPGSAVIHGRPPARPLCLPGSLSPAYSCLGPIVLVFASTSNASLPR